VSDARTLRVPAFHSHARRFTYRTCRWNTHGKETAPSITHESRRTIASKACSLASLIPAARLLDDPRNGVGLVSVARGDMRQLLGWPTTHVLSDLTTFSFRSHTRSQCSRVLPLRTGKQRLLLTFCFRAEFGCLRTQCGD